MNQRSHQIPAHDILRQALTFHRQGRFGEAARLYRLVLRHDRNHFDALYNLAAIEIRQGELDSGTERIGRAIRQRPQSAEAENLLGLALRRAGRFEESVGHFERALALRPDFTDAHCHLAGALRDVGRLREAAEHYQAALAQNPSHAQALFELATLERTKGDCDRAIAHFGAVLALDPELAAAYHGRGHALREIGRLEDAQTDFERAIAIEPENPDYHYSLTYSRRVGEGDVQLQRLQALEANLHSRTDEARVLLHFALGKAYGDVGRYERSSSHLLAANALKRKSIAYDEAEALGALENIARLFAGEIVEERRGFGHPSEAPIFIVGMPRSGSTLVEQILASHPAVFGSGEVMDFAHAVAGLDGPGGLPPDVGGEELYEMGARYLDRVGADRREAARITDKMLGNFRLVGLIHLALPNARIVHTRRDPVDTCLSCFSHLFAVGQGFAYDLGELGRYYRAYETLMMHWRDVIPQSRLIDVHYENVVADLEGEARRIIGFCGLEWDPRCLDFYRTPRPVKTASVTQVRQPIYGSSVGRWKSYGEMLKPLLDELRVSPADPLSPTR